ncbi:hypothetical protein [Streptomyces chattanoogensis]|uniref:Uncharacterized protein n=1 Tax=Streptomyces chattanoogensis TaxID=66876 RepID=A0A0N0XW07_9ACTN|nr:hypothetical protein [Streptomyces chattanoogensis]KPC61207.1 hypothetical protein ADL29_25895 [Streptomyces chattanoogensis]
MRDLSVVLLARLVVALISVARPHPALIRWAERLFPANGRHRAAAPAPAPGRSYARPRPICLPSHKSPYAQEAAADAPFEELPLPVRPYVLAPRAPEPADPEHLAQAERRWALDMALRGIDVGPSRIHGVEVSPDRGTVAEAVG